MNRSLFFLGTMMLRMSLYGLPMERPTEQPTTILQQQNREVSQTDGRNDNEFATGHLKNDLRKKTADLSQQIAVKGQTPSEDNSELWLLENLLKCAEEQLITLDLYHHDISNVEDPARTDINNFLTKSDEAEAALHLGGYINDNRANALSMDARASLACALESMEQGTTRPHIVKHYRTVQQLSAQALEALQENNPEKYFSLYRKALAFEGIAREMAGQNRQSIIDDYKKATKTLVQALIIRPQGDPISSTKYWLLQMEGLSLLSKANEAATKNRQTIIDDYQKTTDAFAEALTTLNQGDPVKSLFLQLQGLSLLGKTNEVATKNRQTIIDDYQKAAEPLNQAVIEETPGDPSRLKALTFQKHVLLKKIDEAATTNRLNIINDYQKAAEIFDQALAAENRNKPASTQHLFSQGEALFKKAGEAATTNRPDIINDYQKAAETFAQALTAENKNDSQRAEVLFYQGKAFYIKAIEAASANRPNIIATYQKAAETFDQSLIARARGDANNATLFFLRGYDLFKKAGEDAASTGN